MCLVMGVSRKNGTGRQTGIRRHDPNRDRLGLEVLLLLPQPLPEKATSLGALCRLLRPPFRRSDWQAASHPRFDVRIGSITTFTEQGSGLDPIERLLARIDGFDSHFREVLTGCGALVAETQIRFRDATGELEAIPCVAIARRVGGKLADLRILLDPAHPFRLVRIDG